MLTEIDGMVVIDPEELNKNV